MIKIMNLHTNSRPVEDPLRRVENIPVELIKPNPYQPRKEFSVQGLEELSQSIREYGIIQPITVRKINLGWYELIAGERRLRAVKILGMENIPAIIINSYEHDSAMMAMIENLQRENLHYMEEAKGYASLIRDHAFTQEQLALKLGKSQSTIANKLRILKLPKKVKDILMEENLTERHARSLLKLPDEELQLKVIGQIISRHLNVKDTETLVEKYIQAIERSVDKKSSIVEPKGRKLFQRTKDVRVFVNTIRQAVAMMKDYGITPQYTQVDKGDSIEITVTIPKG